ncbi:hypothetical protein BaRGS_00001428 [Batillaria attramentaria]|uniref:Uncharacterized protein n=1 Tax=Batillaria attramentaria TaxID=370345 RepID=A0ABD0M7M0_9CAEN
MANVLFEGGILYSRVAFPEMIEYFPLDQGKEGEKWEVALVYKMLSGDGLVGRGGGQTGGVGVRGHILHSRFLGGRHTFFYALTRTPSPPPKRSNIFEQIQYYIGTDNTSEARTDHVVHSALASIPDI